MILDDEPLLLIDADPANPLIDIHPHPNAAIWTRLVPQDAEVGWTDLFNGRDLSGWEPTDTTPPVWRVEESAIVVDGPGRGYLHCDRPFADFELTLEYRTPQQATLGVMLRAPDHQLGARKALELTLYDDASLPHTRLRQDGGSDQTLVPIADITRPAGEWNTVRARAAGPARQVWLNGTLIEDIDAARLRRLVPQHTSLTRVAGRVALQHWGPERLEFRNIRMRTPAPAAAGTTPAAPPRPAAAAAGGKTGGGGVGGGGFGGGGGGFGGGRFRGGGSGQGGATP